MFKNMFEKYKKNKKGQKWHMPNKKVQQYCYIPYKCNILKCNQLQHISISIKLIVEHILRP